MPPHIIALDYFGGGALNATHLLGYLAGTLAAPMLARRLGMPRLSRYAHALVALGALLCAIAPGRTPAGPAVMALGRLGTGLGAGASIVAILVLVFAAVPAASRSLASALVWSGMGFAVGLSGLAAGPLVEGAYGWRAAFAVSAAIAALLALVFPPRGVRAAATEPAAAASHGLRQFLRARWLFLVGAYFMFGAGYIAYSTFAGARLAAVGASLAAVSAMWIAFGAAMIVGSAITFALLRIDRHRLSVRVLERVHPDDREGAVVLLRLVRRLVPERKTGLGQSTRPTHSGMRRVDSSLSHRYVSLLCRS